MINVIVPIVEDVEKFSNFVENSKKTGVKFFVGIQKSLANTFKTAKKSVEIHVFPDTAKKEEIINSLHSCKLKMGKILIVRRPLTNEEFEKLSTSKSDITTLKAGRNKFMTLLKKLGKMIVQRCFAFNFFEDISAICYGESMFELMSVCANLSMASRINKYVGVEIEEIETAVKPVKKEYNRWKNSLIFLMWSIIFAGSVVGGTLVCIYTPVWAMTVVLVMFWICVALMLWLVGLVNFSRTLSVGRLRFGRAEELSKPSPKAKDENKKSTSKAKAENNKSKSKRRKNEKD